MARKKITQEEYINRAHSIHGNYYNYEKLIYVNMRTKVEIICPNHGSYFVYPQTHLRGGCDQCNRDKTRKSNDEFILKSKEIHGNNRYTYEQTEYIKNRIKVKITCPEHGVFDILPSHHLLGKGCKICNNGFNNNYPAFLYILKIYDDYENFICYKLGITNNLTNRMMRLKGNGTLFKIFKIFRSENGLSIRQLEYDIKHSDVQMSVIDRRIFNDGYTETFNDIEKVLLIITSKEDINEISIN